jgi:hypothetical protein
MTTKTPFKFEYATGDDTRADPVRHRRSRLVERLQEQAKLATDPTATLRVLTRNKKGSGPVEIKQIIRPQWRTGGDGKVVFWMKSGAGKIELAPGKFAVVVDAVKTIPAMVEALIERVAAGEFDAQLVKEKKEGKAAGAKPLHTPVKPPAKVAGKRRAA